MAEDRDKTLRKAYGQATQDLREQHRKDFEEHYAKRAKDLGVDWTPRPTAEQKAEQEFRALLEQYPHFADQFESDEEEDQSA